MKESTRNQIAGKYHEAKGKVKETAGRATNRPDLTIEGQGERVAGKVQEKLGKVTKEFEKPPRKHER